MAPARVGFVVASRVRSLSPERAAVRASLETAAARAEALGLTPVCLVSGVSTHSGADMRGRLPGSGSSTFPGGVRF